MNLRKRLRNALLALLIVAVISVSGYCLLGGRDVTFLQALYMTVITLSTVGYGEVVDTSHNPLLRIFNIFVLLFGVAIMIYVISVVTAFLVEGQLSDLFRRRKMEKQISTLNGHYIICGLGDTGRHVAEELQTTGTPFVIVESNDEVARKFCEERHDLLYIIGDATDEAVLDHAGVGRARGLIAALPTDKDNLVITFLVRQKNPAIRIVARCTDEAKFSARMVKAGANSTVSPNRIGGLRLASEVIRPDVVEFLDLMLKEHSHTLRVEQIEIPEGSSWSGVSLDDLNLRTRYQLMPLALKNCGARQSAGSTFQVNPPGEQVLRDGGIVIVLGDVNDVRRAREESHLRRAA